MRFSAGRLIWREQDAGNSPDFLYRKLRLTLKVGIVDKSDSLYEVLSNGRLRRAAAGYRSLSSNCMASNSIDGVPRRGGLFGTASEWIADFGETSIGLIAAFGDITLFMISTLRWAFLRLPKRETIMPNFYQIGVLSLPVIALTGTFIGMVLAVQAYTSLRSIHFETRMGGVINQSLVRELGPVLAATMLAGRVGGAMAAELGTMRVTEQIDALAGMGANPIHYLVVPRFLGCLILIPTLTIMGDFMGVVGGWFYSVSLLEVDSHHYWQRSQEMVKAFDVFSGIFKSLFFGAALSLISCYRGFHCAPGAEGVGRAATSAFVQSFVLILALDLVLGIFLDSIYLMLWPEGGSLI